MTCEKEFQSCATLTDCLKFKISPDFWAKNRGKTHSQRTGGEKLKQKLRKRLTFEDVCVAVTHAGHKSQGDATFADSSTCLFTVQPDKITKT